MRLTRDQVMRLWSVDDPTCLRVLESLVETRFLEVDASGRYRRVAASRRWQIPGNLSDRQVKNYRRAT